MKRELERAARSAYGTVTNGPTGTLGAKDLLALGTSLASLGTALPVAAVWSAARGVIFPQLEASVLPLARTAVQETRALLQTVPVDASKPCPAVEALGKVTPSGNDPMSERRAKLAVCVARALSCAVAPTPDLFAECVGLLTEAQADPDYPLNRERERWTGWLDDVVTRADRFNVLEILELLGSTIDGTIAGLQPDRFFWEGTGNEQGGFEVWTADPRSRKLVTSVATFPQVSPKNGVLMVVVSAAGLAKDPLRIEYFLEHEIHRYFLASAYTGDFTSIDYRIDDGSRQWRAPI